jgi:chemotaxis signal transduction protein
MRLLIGLQRVEYDLETPMIICRTRGVSIALMVDEVRDVVSLPEGCLQPSSGIHSLADRMIGVCRMGTELVFLLDVDRLIDVDVLPEGGVR